MKNEKTIKYIMEYCGDLSVFPIEIIFHILTHLKPNDIYRIAQVSRQFNILVKQVTNNSQVGCPQDSP